MISFLINLGTIFIALKLLSDLFAVSPVAEGLQHRLRSFFERWQAAIENPSANSILTVPFSALAKVYDRTFGSQSFSWQGFRKTCVFGALFMGATLGFAGLFCGKPFAMNLLPWKSYSAAIGYLKIFVKEPALHHQAGDPFFIVQNASDLAKLDGWPFELIFTIYFVVVIVLSNAVLISLSISVSRLFLREMLLARTPFGVFILFLSNTVLLLALGGAASLVLFILLNVWSWPLVPLLLGLSKISFVAGAGVASATSFCSWFFSGTWLKVVVVGSLFPSLIIAIVMGIGLLGFAFSRSLHPLAAFMIRLSLRSPKGIISFYSAVLAVLAFICAGLASLWGLLSRLNSTLNLPSLFGVDYLILSLLCLLSMLLFAWVRVKYDRYRVTSSLRFQDVLFLYLVASLVIGAGFYLEALLSCLLPAWFPPPNSLGSNLSLPALNSIIPGSVGGYFFVVSRLDNSNYYQLAKRIFFTLALFDSLGALLGAYSYRDTGISILCDLLGALVAAVVLVQIHSILFLRKGRD